MTPRELMYKFSKGEIKLDEKNAKELEKLIKGKSVRSEEHTSELQSLL